MCDEALKHEAARPEGINYHVPEGADSRLPDTFLHDLSLKAQEGYRLMEEDGNIMGTIMSAIRGLGAPVQGSPGKL